MQMMPSPTPLTPAVTFDDVSFAVDGQTILHRATFAVDSGSFLGVIGPNGGGKTTLLKLMLGLIVPTSGSVRVFGFVPTDRRARAMIGYVPQRLHAGERAFPATVEEIVRSGRIHAGLTTRSADRAAVDRALETTGMTELRHRTLSQLSGGQAQKVFIARAIVHEPKMLLLDEPTTGIDLPSRTQFEELLRRLHTQRGMTILIVSHEVESLQESVQSVLCVNGTVLAHCSPECFLDEEAFRKLYGDKATLIAHHHHDHHHPHGA